MQEGLALFLKGVGEVEGVSRRSAALAAEAWYKDLLAGYGDDPAEILIPISSTAAEPMARPSRSQPSSRSGGPHGDDLIIMHHIPFTSVCGHHLLPFTGQAAVGYIPGRRLTGLSRLPRLLDCFARRLTTQERIGREVVTALMEHLQARGAACIMQARHTCICARGARSQGEIVTSHFRGAFEDRPALRREFIDQAG